MPNNPPVDYTAKDFDGFRQLLIDAIPDRLPEWTSRSSSDFGIALIELFSYVGDILSFYGDRIANEAFLSTATQRRSLLDIAAMLDYRPTGVSAAATTLRFTVTSGVGNVTIPKGTPVSTSSVDALESGAEIIYFETDADLVIDSSSTTTGTVGGTEGQTIADEDLGTSDGRINQRFTLFDSPVIDGTVTVKVNETGTAETWTYVDHLIDATSDEEAYTLTTDENGVVSVVFGDDINGRIPASGAVITATYRVGAGADGNVSANTVTELVQAIADVLSVTNTVDATGGGDPETLDELRKNIPTSLTSLNRAVTTKDYASMALDVQGVVKASAQADVYTSVNVYIAPGDGTNPTTALKNKVSEHLADKKMIGTTVSVLDPTYRPVNINVDVVVKDNHNRSAVDLAVEEALNDYLAFANVDFNQRISVSDIYGLIGDVAGVSYATLNLLVRNDDANQTNKVADVVININEIPEAGTITVTATGGIVGS